MKTFRLTLTTTKRDETPALAKDWLSDLIDIDAFPDSVDIDAREETTAPSHGDQHPVALTFHCLNNALQVLVGFGDEPSDWGTAESYQDVRRLVEEGVFHLAEFQLLFIRQERLIEEQRVENLKLAREWAAEKTVSKRLEGINTRLVEQHNRARNTAQAMVEQLRALPVNPENFMRPMSCASTEAVRLNGASSTLELAR